MKSRCFKSMLISTALLATTTACIDDSYDLSNIDTTTKIAVNDLEIPVNLDAVKLDNIIELNDDDQVKVYTDAQGNRFYAVVESGTFSSSSIQINEVTCAAPTVTPLSVTIDASDINIPGITIPDIPGFTFTPPAGLDVSFRIPLLENKFAYDIRNIDPAIHSVKKIAIEPMSIKISMALTGVEEAVSAIQFKNIKIAAPKGFSAKVIDNLGSYNPETGEILIPELTTTDCKSIISLEIDAIDFEAFGCSLDYNTHTMSYAGEINVEAGEIHAITSGKPIPTSFKLDMSITLDNIVATKFTGDVEYTISGFDIPDVDISSLPDFLSDAGTNLSLVNPEIFINLNNPVGNYGLDCQTGVTLIAKRNSQPNQYFTTDEPYFTIGSYAGNGNYSYCLSPKTPTEIEPSYEENFSWIAFSSLSNLLAGEGLPHAIGITLNDPCIPKQTVTDFQLGTNIDGVNGRYELFAPLALVDGSTIIYTATETGWGRDELEKITVNDLEITANVTSTIPLNVKLTGSLIDRNGNPIDATLTCAEIPASAQNAPLTITLHDDHSLKDLDGIKFTAKVTAKGETAISPDMTITLSNIHAKVSGYYITKL